MRRTLHSFLTVLMAMLLISAPVTARITIQDRSSVGSAIQTQRQPIASNSPAISLSGTYGSYCKEINGHKYCVKDVWAEPTTAEPGETVTIKAEIENEGSKKGTISTYLGVRPPGESKSYPDSQKEYDIAVGERVTLEYQYTVPNSGPTGEYEVTVDVWTGNDAEMFHSSGWKQVFDVTEPSPEAQIVDVDVDGGDYTTGETVDTTVTVENTGSEYHRFYVGYSARGPDGEWRDNGGTTHESIGLSAGEEDSITLDWDVEDDAPTGDYDVATAVYTGIDGDELQNQVDYDTLTNEFDVVVDNSAPTINIDYPSSDTTIKAGGSVEFGIDADDSNGNLDGVEWYVDGNYEDSSDLFGSADSSDWTRQFDEAGTYRVEAIAYDDQESYSESVSWTVTVEEQTQIGATITAVAPADGEYTAGESATTTVTIENTGNTFNEFAVGYSVRGPDGEWRDNGGTTHESIGLSAGEEDTITLDWDVEDGAPTGDYDVWTAVYEDRNGDDLVNRLDDEQRSNTLSVVEQNASPTVDRASPSTETTVTAGDSVDFSVDARDTNGNLDGVEWYVDGNYEDSSELSGGADSSDWTRAFDQAGTYRVEAIAYDTESSYSEPLSWTITVEEPTQIGATITAVAPADGEYTAGESAITTVTIENTGNTFHEFAVGYSVSGPDGEWRDNGGTTHESIGLSAGEEDTITLDWDVEDDAPTGDYDVWTTVYEDRDGDDLVNRLDDEQRLNTFSVVEKNTAPAVNRDGPNEETTVTAGDSVEFSVDARDTNGNLDGVEWYVDGSYESTTDLTGEEDSSDWTWAFDQAGTYRVEAIAYDTESSYSEPLSWTITVEKPSLQAELISVQSTTESVTPDGTPRIQVTVQNTGPRQHDFYLTAGARGPDGSWTLAEATDVRVQAGAQNTVQLPLSPGSSLSAGQYDIEAAVYRTDAKSDRFDADGTENAFQVESVEHELVVRASPGGSVAGAIDTSDGSDGVATYDAGTTVTLTANPDSGYGFNGWTGDVPDSKRDDRTITVTVDGDMSLTPQFEEAETTLLVTVIDSRGNPVSGVNIGYGIFSDESVRTDSNGIATLEFTPPSKDSLVYDGDDTWSTQVDYWAPEYGIPQDRSKVESVSLKRGQTNRLTITLPASAIVSGVVESGGEPINEAKVLIGDHDVTTLRDGSFEFNGPIPQGSYYVRVKKNNQVILRQVKDIDKGYKNFELEVPKSKYQGATGTDTYVQGVVSDAFDDDTADVHGEIYGSMEYEEVDVEYDSDSISSAFYTTDDGRYYTSASGPCAWSRSKGSCGLRKVTTGGKRGSTRALTHGMVSGFKYGGEETVNGFKELMRPVQYTAQLFELAMTIAQDIGLLETLIAAVPKQIKRQQRQDNSYPEDSVKYDNFRTGWYSGYGAYILITSVVSAGTVSGATKTISTTSKFSKYAEKASGLDRSTKMSRLSRKASEIGDSTPSSSYPDLYDAVDSETATRLKQYKPAVQQRARDLTQNTERGPKLLNALDEDATKALLKLDIRGEDTAKWRESLAETARDKDNVELNADNKKDWEGPYIRNTDAAQYAKDLREVESLRDSGYDIENVGGLMDETADSPDASQILGQQFETHRTLQYAKKADKDSNSITGVKIEPDGRDGPDMRVKRDGKSDIFVEQKIVAGDLTDGLKIKDKIRKAINQDKFDGVESYNRRLEIGAQRDITDDFNSGVDGETSARESIKSLIRNRDKLKKPLPKSASDIDFDTVRIVDKDGNIIEEFELSKLYKEVKNGE